MIEPASGARVSAGANDDVLARWLATVGESPGAEIPRADRSRPLRASHAQRGMWLAQQIAAATDFSHVSRHAYRLRGALDVPALRAAYGAVIARHEALRTTFAAVDGELFARVRDELAVELAVVDCAGAAAASALMDAFYRTPFDLEREALIRARVFRLAPREHVLLIAVHHIANDGWSMGVLHRELGALYAAARALGPLAGAAELAEFAEFPELRVQFPDYAVWQRALADRDDHHAVDLAYWREQLDGAPAGPLLRGDRPRPQSRSSAGDRLAFAIPGPLAAAVERCANACGVTAFVVQLTAFEILLAGLSDQSDAIVGVTTANRKLPETEPLIGLFVNVLPIRARLDPAERFSDAARRIHRVLLGAYDHDEVPFELLLSALGVARSAAFNPLIQVTVASHHALTDPLALEGLAVEYLEPEALDVQEDLTLYFTSTGGGTTAHLAFSTELFERTTIERLAGEYRTILERAVTADPPLSELGVRPARSVVPAASETGGDDPSSESAPRGTAERLVAAIWSDVLGGTAIARDANFFRLGGTSLAATRVANRLSAQLGRRVPARTLFEHSDLIAFAHYVESLVLAAIEEEAGRR